MTGCNHSASSVAFTYEEEALDGSLVVSEAAWCDRCGILFTLADHFQYGLFVAVTS